MENKKLGIRIFEIRTKLFIFNMFIAVIFIVIVNRLKNECISMHLYIKMNKNQELIDIMLVLLQSKLPQYRMKFDSYWCDLLGEREIGRIPDTP